MLKVGSTFCSTHLKCMDGCRMKEAAVVLKCLYDEDIIEDGLLVGWAHKTDAAHVLGVPSDGARLLRRQDDVQKLVNWLNEDEDEDDDEETEEEDDE
jgi:translation initiation factor 5